MKFNLKDYTWTTIIVWIGLMALGVAMLAAQSKGAENTATRAVAVLHPTAGSQVSGTVRFAKNMDGVGIAADLSGLSPGEHGFHIHQWGDCTASDGSSAGGHYNPFNKPHGGPMDKERHLGDLGNIVAQANGKAHYERTDKVISLEGPDSIIGRSVIVHAGQDDLKTQPAGNAGARVACGVIGYQQ
ncbi:MAG: superoxide dismutase family protein [Desulfobacteraceae bacterium]|nr:superoxide dismutase family protein [Desulfobacteraceae bacterium]